MLYLFDLDGTIITSYMDNPGRRYHAWSLLPRRRGAIQVLREEGHDIRVITNQAGVAFQYVTEEEVLVKFEDVAFKLGYGYITIRNGIDEPYQSYIGGGVMGTLDFYVSYADERSPIWRYRQRTDRRKPRGTMLLEAIADAGLQPADALYIGDRDEDEQAANDAGVRFCHSKAFMWAEAG